MTPDGSQGSLKSIKNQGFFWHGFREAKKWVPYQFLGVFWLHFGSILGAKFEDFSCYFLASFFDRFLIASGTMLGGILDDFGSYCLILFPTLRKKADLANSPPLPMKSRFGRLEK